MRIGSGSPSRWGAASPRAVRDFEAAVAEAERVENEPPQEPRQRRSGRLGEDRAENVHRRRTAPGRAGRAVHERVDAGGEIGLAGHGEIPY